MIENTLDRAGCQPGLLQLIILTHGDFDHSGNAAYFRDKFDARLAMPEADLGMVERGDMFWNRKPPHLLVKFLMGLLFRLGRKDRFKPDFFIKAGDHLAEYGFDAQVVALPGHSKGSIGLLTAQGDFFCGDLSANVGKPDVWSIMDDPVAANDSLEKLTTLEINTVYPGHGRPFLMPLFLKQSQVTA